jgi:hypothetical protein
MVQLTVKRSSAKGFEMAKKIVRVSGFDLSIITRAFLAADDAAASFDAMCAEMAQWHAAGVFPVSGDVKAALVAAGRPPATAGSYASKMLTWAASGKQPRNISQMVQEIPAGHVKKKAGRPVTATKTATKTAAAAPAPGAEISPMHRWNVVMQDMVAQALVVRNAKNQVMGVEDAKAVQAALMNVKAIIGKYL